MPKVFLVRHGESTSNVSKVISGRDDFVPLTDRGRAQAQQAGRTLAQTIDGPVHIVSSPLERAHHTARHIADELGVPHDQIQIEHDLIERGFGDLEGAVGQELGKQPGYNLLDDKGRAIHADPDWKPNGGESLRDVQERAVPAIERLKQQHPGKHLIIVSHGHTIKALLCHHRGSWRGHKRVDNAEIRQLGEGYSVFFHAWKCPGCGHTWVAQDDDEGRQCHVCPCTGLVFESVSDRLILSVLYEAWR